MGGKSSKGESSRRSSSFGSSSSWRNAYPQSPFGHGSPTHEQYSNPPHQDYAYGNDVVEDVERKFHRKYSRIADDYESLEEVTEALADAGLESSNLIVGIDFTKSNEWKGARSFNRQSLHHIGDGLNPYEQAISIIGKTLAAFDEDNLIPCFGFGDATTHDQDVFNFNSDEKICNGFEAVLSRYREIVPHLRLAGPTSFAPIIEMAMNIVEQSGGQYHILVIIADGQVTRADAGCGKLSPQEQKTVNAIVEASKFPLSIILVGVGDGPWDMMKEFDDNIPARDFDNFQFVNFTDIMTKDIPASQKEAAFALAALMEIPSQYKALLELNLLGGKANAPYRYPRLGRLPPPIYDSSSSNSGNSSPVGTTRRATSFSYDNKVTEALARAGLESSNLIVGIDFTKSNEWTGARSFNRLSLHHIGDGQNPYEQAISIIGKTLAAFDEDNLIPCFGFGDATTHDQDVFSFFHPPKRFCNGFEEVLSRYREIVPHLCLAGPTSFAPIIEMAMTIVEKSGGQYHVLVIIADGQVTRSIDTGCGKLSPQEQKTVDAIVKASKFPLSIILVGVGDGPWDLMKEFDDNIPDRDFDNFHFVNFTEIVSENIPPSQIEETFAGAALMEIPSQYKSTIELNLLGNWKANARERVPLPPPINVSVSLGSSPLSNASSSEPSLPPCCGECSPVHTAPPPTSSSYNNQLCPICLSNSKDIAFGCGHQTCCECGQDLQCCPLCRSPIHIRIKLY